MNEFRFTLIDESSFHQHPYLKKDDKCYCWGTYTPRVGFNYSQMNQLIANLKKGIDRKRCRDYPYKEEAIKTIAHWVAALIPMEKFTFVPIPPSHCKSDPLYDDRMVLILKYAKFLNNELDFCEIVEQKTTMQASHCNENRSHPGQLVENYKVDKEALNNARSTIIIFDDVLTAGSHFKAMKEVILQHRSDVKIIGLFVARVQRQEES